jgi:hypothetical protein
MPLVLERNLALQRLQDYFIIVLTDLSSYKQSPPQEKAFPSERHLLTILPGK